MADRSRGSRDRRKRKKEQTEYFFDYSLLFIVLFLMGFGLVMIYSASSYEAQQDFGSGTYYLRRQLIADILGLVVMIVMANIPYRFWRRFTTLAYFVSFGLIFMVLTPLGVSSHGAKRWVGIPGTGFNVQPAEVAKVCMILFLANMVCLMGKKLRTAKGLTVLIALSLPHSLAVWKVTENLSSAIIILGIAMLMIFVATPDYKRFVIMGLIASALILGHFQHLHRRKAGISRRAHSGLAGSGGICPGQRLPDTAGPICHRFRRHLGQGTGTEYAEAGLYPRGPE